MASILIVEDEQAMQDIIADYMRKGGHRCFTAGDGLDALVMLKEHPMDLLILDVMIPHLDGFSVCRMAREMSDMPVIMLTARGAEDDKLNGYGCGADDYMTKPFSPEELLARVRALSRRQGEVQLEELRFDDLCLGLSTRSLSRREKAVTLGFKEFEVLRILLSNPKRIVPKEDLLTRVWGTDSDAEDNNVEAYISFLRKKLKHLGSKCSIETIRKAGYRFVEG